MLLHVMPHTGNEYDDGLPECYKTEFGNKAQISNIGLAEMTTCRRFSKSNA